MGTDQAPRNLAQLLRVLLKYAFLAAVPYCLSFLSLRYIGRHLGSGDRIEILCLFAAGVLFASVAGVAIARLLLSLRAWVAVTGFTIVALASYQVAGLITRTANGFQTVPLQTEVISISVGAALLAAGSYAVGCLLVPGRTRVPGVARLVCIIGLYGAILVGVARGISVGGYLPLQTGDHAHSEESRDWPSIKQAVPDSHSQPAFRTWESPSGGLGIYRRAPDSAPQARFDAVISATQPDLSLSDHRLTVLDHGLLQPRGMKTSAGSFGATWLRTLGIPEDDRSTYEAMRSDCEAQYAFLLRADRELNIHNENACVMLLGPDLRIDHNTRIERAGREDNNRERILLLSLPRYYFPGPAELRLDLWWGRPTAYSFTGETARHAVTPQNRFTLLKALEGRFYTLSNSPSSIVLHPIDELTGPASTTVVVHAVLEQPTDTFHFQVLLRDGTDSTGKPVRYSAGFYIHWFPVAQDEIEEIQVVALPHHSDVRIPITELKGFPRSNRGCRNLLEVRVPQLRINDPWQVKVILERILGARFQNFGSVAPQSINTELKDVSVRRILDTYFPDNWGIIEDYRTKQNVVSISPFVVPVLTEKIAYGLGIVERDRLNSELIEMLRSLVYLAPAAD